MKHRYCYFPYVQIRKQGETGYLYLEPKFTPRSISVVSLLNYTVLPWEEMEAIFILVAGNPCSISQATIPVLFFSLKTTLSPGNFSLKI